MNRLEPSGPRLEPVSEDHTIHAYVTSLSSCKNIISPSQSFIFYTLTNLGTRNGCVHDSNVLTNIRLLQLYHLVIALAADHFDKESSREA